MFKFKFYVRIKKFFPKTNVSKSLSTYHIFDNLIFAVMFLDFEKMVAEIQHCKAALLSEQYNDHAASPVEPISKTLPVSTKQPTE